MPTSKIVLITGCSPGGIGSALALEFRKQGHHVYATVRSLEKGSHLTALGIQVLTMDVTSDESVQEAVKQLRSLLPEGKNLDILINNSGIGYAMPFADAELSAAKTVFETNVFGRWRVTQALLPMLLSNRGTIINIGSISAICPTPWSSIYNAACSAVHQWSDTLRLELAPFGVKVILIITGGVESKFLSNIPAKGLPRDSIYLPCRQQVEETMLGAAAGKFYPAEDYARVVVSKLAIDNVPKRFWLGTLTHRLWYVHTFLWDTAWDLILRKPFGLASLQSITQSKASKID